MSNIILENKNYNWDKMTLIDFVNEGNIPSGWKDFFYMNEVQLELYSISNILYKLGKQKIIYPPINKIFRAFYDVPVNKIKAVIVGMDPYHNGSAVGLCFSVKKGNKINPSLRNIYKELVLEGYNVTKDGDLSHWAKQGVLMINMALTVEKSKPGSHSKIWNNFSQLLVKYLSLKKIKWILLGKQAHKLSEQISHKNCYCTSHPSPFSAYRNCGLYPPFIGSKIFNKIQNINW